MNQYPITITPDFAKFRGVDALRAGLATAMNRKEVQEAFRVIATSCVPTTLPHLQPGETTQEGASRTYHFMAGLACAKTLLDYLAKKPTDPADIGVDGIDESDLPPEFQIKNQPK